MVKILALILTILGIIGLVFGVFGIFGNLQIGLNHWALVILGLIFFFGGISLFRFGKNTSSGR